MSLADVARESLAKHGKVKLQPASDWTGTIGLPPGVAQFYHEVGPVDITIESFGNPYFLPRLSGLWEFQTGYRWSLEEVPLDDWPPDWLVVADEGGAAFILAISRGVILCGIHGPRLFGAVEIFPDLNTMAICLSRLGSIVAEAGSDFTDASCIMRPEYRDRSLTELHRWLGSDAAAASALMSLGWD
jgi:hypothetical protein